MNNFAGIDLFFLKNIKNAHILDYGCGDGAFSVFLIKNGFNVMAVDINPESEHKISAALNSEEKSRFKFMLLIGQDNLNNYSQKFDYIICREVLEHIKDYENIINIFSNIIKSSGVCIISVPTFLTEKYFAFWDKNWFAKCEHVNIFKKKDILNLAKLNNFEVARISSHSFNRTIFWSLVVPFKIEHRMGKILNKNRFINFTEYLSNAICSFKFIDKLGNKILPKSKVYYFKK
ncbi:class I SAM-dependent methyltransferase [Candidatus Dependentiae bacterium]|nr:class I SAM-dependent methyltransferase [Candidatus Dependentiae bacterium]